MQDDETYILGDVDAFLAALETGSMQDQWCKDQARCRAWIARDGPLPNQTAPQEVPRG